ncbi:HNH endonuclease signature motif containing protein [soil metagenome]
MFDIHEDGAPGSDLITLRVDDRPSTDGVAAIVAACSSLASLNLDQQVDLLVLIDKHRAWLDALHQKALTAMVAADSSDARWSTEQAAAALRISPRAMPRRIATAKTLSQHLPGTLSALESGAISQAQAHVVATASWSVSAENTPEFERRVLGAASEQTLPEFTRTVEQARIALAPISAEERRLRAAKDRAVAVRHLPDGLMSLHALLPAVDGAAIFERLTAATVLLPSSDLRTRDQQRADLLVDAVLNSLDDRVLPQQHGHRPQISVHVSLSTIAGADDQPGYLDGYGAITAHLARELAFNPNATWRRLVTDPADGQVLEFGRRPYRPPLPLADLVIARDSVCCFPGCSQPGRTCDIDHIAAWNSGGRTQPSNMAALCRRHHNGKTEGHFGYRRNRDGSYLWSLGGRHRYLSRLPRRLLLDAARANPVPGAPQRPGPPELAHPPSLPHTSGLPHTSRLPCPRAQSDPPF